MKKLTLALTILFAAAGLLAQQKPASQSSPAQPESDDQKIVAVVNGEVITKAKLDSLYKKMGPQMHAQYEQAGGKAAFLDNYIEKRLLLQEALKSGFDKKKSTVDWVEAAKESALYDKYVRDTVAPTIVPDAEVRKYYDEHTDQFVVPETAKVRHIVISWNRRTKEEALDKVKEVATEIRKAAPDPIDPRPVRKAVLLNTFIAAARKYSEDGVAEQGGDLGWVARGSLDKDFEAAAFGMRPMTMSGVVESKFGYHLILVEDKKPQHAQDFSDVKDDIREFLLAEHAADVLAAVKRTTNELRRNSKISIYSENVN